MKRLNCILASIAVFFSACPDNVLAQDNGCDIPVMVKVREGNIPDAANADHLADKLDRMLTQQGFGGSELANLCLEAVVSENDKEVISGTRALVVADLEVNLVLSNVLSGEKFGSISTSIKGTGKNESQAFRKALAQFKASDDRYQYFLQRCRSKIMDYYRTHIPSIVRQSEILADRGEYEKALYGLAAVPPCAAGYEAVADALMAVWQNYRDTDCNAKLAKAKAIWHSSQTEEAAREAASYIAAIDRRSACVEEADELLADISSAVGDNIARTILREDEDRDFEKEMARSTIDLKRQEIDAIRELALAYVRNVVGPVVDNMTRKPDVNIITPKPEEK